MYFNTLHIIFLILIAFLLLVVFLLITKLRNYKLIEGKKKEKLIIHFESEKAYFEKEIKRQNYILEEIKNKNGSKHEAISTGQRNLQHSNMVSIENSNMDMALSNEKAYTTDTDFKEKNKKLWELSISVHKEKERIEHLKKQIEHRHNEVTKSITYARRIQKALLPSSKILGIRFSDYFILWKPKDIVSGDFYWFKRLEDSMIIVVADCTGHGVPGAFMSLLGISFLNDLLTKDKTLKSFQILDKLREMIKLALQQERGKKSVAMDGIDMAISIINHKTLELDFAGANNPLYLIRNNQIIVLKENRNPVGIHPFEKPFENHHYDLKRGDKLYMFSDGYVDQFGARTGRKFLRNNFQRLLLHISNLNLTMQEEQEILEETLDEWRGNVTQIDDILVLGLKI
jgi:serine phosphatase RsbU (regulator of sigma subunit)